ncbi:DUF6463 family protein [Sphingopyxis sp.]|uniref:DUF6463 family protein n=1 Tax=Sphingopyxis sp. TaxID=1908224 RepID=UPI003D6CF292
MIRWSAYMMIAIGILHMLVLGYDALPVIRGWAQFDLWTMTHTTTPPADRPFEIVVSTDSFWATIGGFAIPFIVFGALLLWLDRRGYPLPSFVGWCLGGWALVNSLIMQPSGFPLLIIVAALLVIGARRQRRAGQEPRRQST